MHPAGIFEVDQDDDRELMICQIRSGVAGISTWVTP
jgi:hypothetical protein